jgi:hypothetical protein
MPTKPDVSDVMLISLLGAICALGILFLALVWKDGLESPSDRPRQNQELHERMFHDADSRARMREELAKKPH